MSITDERKFAFLGSEDPEIQKAMIDNSLALPEGYIFQLDTYLKVMQSQENEIPKYIECINGQESYFIDGRVYEVQDRINLNSVRVLCNIACGGYSPADILWVTLEDASAKYWKPSTKEAYEAQKETKPSKSEYIPQVGDYVVMEKAGGWGYSPDNNGCVAIVNRVGKSSSRVDGDEVFSVWGEVINPNKDIGVKFSDIPQFGYGKEVIFRKALPHEIPGSNVKAEPQQVEEWSIGTYAVALKGNFGVFSGSDRDNKLSIGSIFTIESNNETNNSVGVKEAIYWIYKENLKWFATHSEAVQFSKRLPQFEASPTTAISEDPLEICRRKYKKGMLVRSAEEYGEYSGTFIIDVDPSEFCYTGSGVDYFKSVGWLYIDGKFAEILEESKEKVIQYPITPENAFPVKAIQKQIKKNKFQEVHEIKIVEEKLLKKTKSKLFNI